MHFPACHSIVYARLFLLWLYTISLISDCFSQVLYTVKIGALKPLCDLLVVNDAKIVMVILDALSNVLENAQRTSNLEQVSMIVEECDGLDKIEALQQHENSDVYQLALAIIEKYFSEEVSNLSNPLHCREILACTTTCFCLHVWFYLVVDTLIFEHPIHTTTALVQ